MGIAVHFVTLDTHWIHTTGQEWGMMPLGMDKGG